MREVRGDDFAAKDDQVIRLRAAGRTYQQIADEMGFASSTNAQNRYRAARARQIPPEYVPRAHPKPSEFYVAWAAGFFDGEGCIFGYEDVQGGYRRFSFGVLLAQTAAEPVELLQRLWGGSTRIVDPPVKHHRRQWLWSVRGADAATFLSDLLPHLRVKRASAAIAIPCLFRTHQHGQPFTEAEIDLRRRAIAFLRIANGRGEARQLPA